MHEENLNKHKRAFAWIFATCCRAKLFSASDFFFLFILRSRRERAKAEINKIWKSHYAMFMHNLTCHSQETERKNKTAAAMCVFRALRHAVVKEINIHTSSLLKGMICDNVCHRLEEKRIVEICFFRVMIAVKMSSKKIYKNELFSGHFFIQALEG